MAKCITVPLWLIFLLQAALVCGAFAALIALMTTEFSDQYTEAVHEKLRLSQKGAASKIGGRFESYEETANIAVQQYLRGRKGGYQLSDNTTIQEATPFFDAFYIFPELDSSIEFIYENVYSNLTLPGTNKKRWTATTVDKLKYALIYEGYGTAYWLPTPKPWTIEVGEKPFGREPFELASTTGYEAVGWVTRPFWMNVAPFFDPAPVGRWTLLTILINPFDIRTLKDENGVEKPFAYRNIAFVVKVSMLLPAITEAAASNSSTVPVVYSLDAPELAIGAALVTAANVNFELFNATGDGFEWPIDHIPNKLCRDMYYATKAQCDATDDMCRTPIVFEEGDYVVAAVSVYTSALSGLLLVQYTPRDFFFADGDATRRNGIIIGVFAAAAVVLSCLLVWLTIKRPLNTLKGNMDLAADMRNEEVVETSPVLSEIATLSSRFTAMNNKLLAARPFLPQSLLQSGGDDEGEGEHEALGESVIPGTHATSLTNNECSMTRSISVFKHAASTSTSADVASRPTKLRMGGNGLTFKRVAVLCANVRDFTGLARDSKLPPESLLSSHTQLLGLVQAAAQANGGIVDYFHGDRFVCTFNAARSCATATRGAAACSVLLRDSLTASPLAALFPKGIAMGFSAGRALVGNMGTDAMKRFSTVGAVFTEAMALQDSMCSVSENSALFVGTVLPDIELSVMYEVYGVVPARRLARGMHSCTLPEFSGQYNANFEALWNNIKGTLLSKMNASHMSGSPLPGLPVDSSWDRLRHVIVCVVRSSNDSVSSDAEWMYELQNIHKANPYKVSNAALIEFFLYGTCKVAEVTRNEPQEANNNNNNNDTPNSSTTTGATLPVLTLIDRMNRGTTSEYILTLCHEEES